MKTNLSWANTLRPALALLLGLTLTTAAHAQDDETPAYFRRPLRVQTAAGKEADIADFARTFAHADNVGDWLYSIALARIDGRQPKISQDEQLTYLIDRPHGYFCTATSRKGGKPFHHTLEICYWRTDTDRRLVAVCYYNDLGTELLLFYDYNPATGLMTPLAKPPFQDFHEFLRELIVQLPREGKDIHMKRCWDGGPPPLTLRWDGHGTFTTVGAAERYRQPAPNQPATCDFIALFKPQEETSGDPVDLYDAPGGKVIRHLGTYDLDYALRVKRAENGWAHIDYGDDPLMMEPGSSKGSAWVRCTTLYVLPAGHLYENYIYAEPTRAARRVATFNEAMDNITDTWWKVLEIRKGWIKIRTNHLGITGWIEARFLCGSEGVDC